MPDKEKQLVEVDDLKEDLGKIEISPGVIEVIAAIAASEIVGVGDKHGNFMSGTAEKIGNRKLRRGVKVDLTEAGIVIDVMLTIKFGVSIPKVAEEVQDNIVQTLRRMTALDVHEVNIHVVGVRFDQNDNRDFVEAEED
ncbi:MAG: Asp23/Gls24 family envelope stress response protein [Sporolactobacillus sp.]